MCCVVDAQQRPPDSTSILLDGGSDIHLGPAHLAVDGKVRPTKVKARDVQAEPIDLIGEQECPFGMKREEGTPKLAAANMLLSGRTRRSLLSTGLHDAGYDIIYSQRHGCFLGEPEGDDGRA